MNLTELRIGNLVEVNGTIEKITGVIQYGLYFNCGYCPNINDWIKPIPLTKEWLMRFGFVYRQIYFHFPNNEIFKLEQYKNKNAFWLRYYTESIDCTRINFVHQLQNLFFALTGEELKLSEK